MKNKIAHFAAVFATLVFILSGCGAADEKPEEAAPENNNATEGTEAIGETVLPSDAKNEKLKIVFKRCFDYIYDDQKNINIIDYSYQVPELEGASKEKYPALNEMLEKHFGDYSGKMDEYVNEHKDTALNSILSDKDIDYKEFLPYTYNSDVNIRRADDSILSFVYFIRENSGVDSEAEEHIRAVSFDTETGKELKLSDIVADTEGLVKLLLPALTENARADFEGAGFSFSDIEKSFPENVSKNINEGAYEWSYDPTGITLYFERNVLGPVMAQVFVPFDADRDNTVFKNIKKASDTDDYVVYFNVGSQMNFDVNGDGKMDTLKLNTISDEWDESLNLEIEYNGRTQNFELEMAYELFPMLVHKDGRTWLLLNYLEYDWTILDVYRFTDSEVRSSDYIVGDFVSREFFDYSEWDDGVSYIKAFTNPQSFTLEIYTQLLSTAPAYADFSFENGGFKRLDDFFTIKNDEDMFVINLKLDEMEVSVIDKETHKETGKTTIRKGQSLKLMYTDNETYVDCLTGDGILVRIYIDTTDLYTVNGYELNEAFDNMFYAG